MDSKDIHQILDDPQFHQVARMKARVGWTLTLLMLAIFLGYLLLVSLNPAYLHESLNDGITTKGIPIGIAVILSAIVLAGIYAWYANNHFDKLTAQVVRRFHHEK